MRTLDRRWHAPLTIAMALNFATAPAHSSEVCYAGSNEPLCIETRTSEQFSDAEKRDYRYLAPSRSNGFPSSFDPRQYAQPQSFADLRGVSGSDQVSPFFRLEEFMAAFKGNYGIFSRSVVESLQRMREGLGGPLVINSAFRGPAYNEGVGGAVWSRHKYGDAVDISIRSQGSLQDIKDQCLAQGASFTQLYRTHIHCDWRSRTLDGSFFPSSEPSRSLRSVESRLSDASSLTIKQETGFATSFRVEHPEAEDGGDLLYQWTIDDGQELREVSTYTPELSYSLLIDEFETPISNRDIRVEVLIGGSVLVAKRFPSDEEIE